MGRPGALLLVAAPAAVALGVAEGWHETIIMLAVGGVLGVQGWGRLTQQVRLERSAVEIRGPLRSYRIPWPRLHGVRREEAELLLACEPDVVITLGPFDRCSASPPLAEARTGAALAEEAGAIMMRQRALALAAGDAYHPVSNRLGTAVVIGAPYLAVCLALIWWRPI